MSSAVGPRIADRVESFIAAIDIYEPTIVQDHADAFRVFARFVSRTLDGRYLDRHPPSELLPDLEHLMQHAKCRTRDEIKVLVELDERDPHHRGVLTVCLADQQFLYSTVQLALEHLSVRRFRAINTGVPVSRDNSGKLLNIGQNQSTREAYIWVEIEAPHLDERKREIEEYIRGRLEAARSCVQDWRAMHALVGHLADRFDAQGRDKPDHRTAFNDSARLLRWLLEEHFVLLGAKFLPHGDSTIPEEYRDLGVGRLNDWRGIQIEVADEAIVEYSNLPPFLWIRKSRTESWVYRAGRTDHILVQAYNDERQPVGVLILEGLFSFHALAEPRTDIPLLDRVVDELYAQLRATKGTHRYRTIRNAFNSLPLEYLFSLQPDDIRSLVEQVLDADSERRPQLHITGDENQATAFVFVALPRSHYNDELRSDIRRILKMAFSASSVDDGVYAGDVDTVTFHYFLTGVESLASEAEEQLREKISQLASPWSERLYDQLQEKHTEQEARRLFELYGSAFPTQYQESTSVARAARDIEILDTMGLEQQFECDMYRENIDEPLGVTRLRIFESQDILLSNILPMLDNLRMVVIDQFPTAVHVPGRPEQSIATFRISGVANTPVDLLSRRNRLRAAISALVAGSMANDPLNRLLLRADIPWTYVVLMRAYETYGRQLGSPYGASSVRDVLLDHGDITRALTEYFRAKFDPEIKGLGDSNDEQRAAFVKRSRKAVLTLLETVSDLASDQILRQFFNLIEATVRTNFYDRDPVREPCLALKFDPSIITRMPEPRAYREIFVHHPKVMGLHLRGGPVARGGIRWSDRRLDFRTEVLGLMATQNLKNVVIVPRGAKGSFVLLEPPADPQERREAADTYYKVFIRGLLSVVDNLVDGKPTTPQRIIKYEDYDHYLVVAADKGTAHLSDSANEVAREKGFWLGDAFASGGSQGYDHKKEGITARGAWECVRRHFRELGVNPEKDTIAAVGIGDMSGDVFGNGMLRSKSMKLLAAFDHRNIFVDPSPDPEKSFAERQRLFELPRSSWEDYDPSLISAGGGVYPRRAKSVPLSPEVQSMLGVSETAMSGEELIRRVLRLPADLLWNGGIGTYVKGQKETHLDVGDPANDAVRISAKECNFRVIGEGGNLGITPTGRIELAQRGTRLNTDAIDNSGGVDLSDHEVNLKILLDGPVRGGKLRLSQRDEIMEEIREEVDHMVLKNNWIQSRMLSLDEARSQRNLMRFHRAMVFLAVRVPFERREMHLPGERIMSQRRDGQEGLHRPELAALASNAKLDLRQELVEASAFDLDRLREELFSYFPQSVSERFADLIPKHPLAINIARTVLTNNILGDAGSTWLAETTIRTGRKTQDILEMYFRSCRLLYAVKLKASISKIELNLVTEIEYTLRIALEDALEALCHWFLRRKVQPEAYDAAFRTALKNIEQYIRPNEADTLRDEARTFAAASVPEDLALEIARLKYVDMAMDTAAVVQLADVDHGLAAQYIRDCAHRTGLGPLVRVHPPSNPKELDSPARFAVRDQLRRSLVGLVVDLLKHNIDLTNLDRALQDRFHAMQTELEGLTQGARGLSGLVLAADRAQQRIGQLLHDIG